MANSKTVEKTLKILEIIANSPEGITLSEIYKALDLPKATTYDILATLYKEDAIYYKDRKLKTYAIGSKIYAISQAYTKNSLLVNYSKEYLKIYSDKYGLTVFSHKRVDLRSVIIFKYEPKDAKINSEDVGTSTYLYANPVGRTFMAFLSEEKLAEVYDTASKTGVAEREIQEIKAEVQRIKEAGYLIDDGIYRRYMCTYAIPVFNFEDKMVGVLSASRVKDNEKAIDIKIQLEQLLSIAENVSEKQGYRGNFYEQIKF